MPHRAVDTPQNLFSLHSISRRKAYKVLLKNILTPPTSQGRLVKYSINESELSLYYLLPFVVTHETKLSIFRFKILHNILPTNLHLYGMNICDSSSCPICSDSTQTIEHMFITCSSAIKFWNQFYKWYIFEPLSRFTNTEILYGIIQNNSIEITLNHIILIAKYHIYCIATTNAHLDFAAFLERLKNLRWLPPVLHFPEPLNFTKGFLAHHDGLVPVLARWCYNSF